MKKDYNRAGLLLLCIALLLAAATAVYLWAAKPEPAVRAHVLLLDFLILTLAQVAIMWTTLRRSLKQTLYAYRNVGLIGGILFSAVMAVSLTAYFLSCIKNPANLSAEAVSRMIQSFPGRFSDWGTGAVLAVCVAVAVSNVSLIRHEGVCPANLLGILLAMFFGLGALGVNLFTDFLEQRLSGSPQAAGIYTLVQMFLMLLLCYVECMFAGVCAMGYITARHVPAYDKDFIIILGCSLDKRGGLLPLLKGRTNRAIKFAWEQEIASGKPCRYVPSGGQGPNEVMSEGSAMELYLLSHGAEEDEVFPEKKSRDTYENMLFSKRVIDGVKPEAKIAFATTNYHIFRSGILARTAGFDAEGIASDTKWYFWPNGFVREFFAILAMKKTAHLKAVAVLAVYSVFVCAAAQLLQLA